MASYLSEADLVTASQVSRSWRAALFSHATLWTSLAVRLPSPTHLRKAHWWCQHTGQRLGSLEIAFDMDPAVRDADDVCDAFAQMASIIRQLDGGKHIYALVLSVWSFSAWSVLAVDAFMRAFLNRREPKGFLGAIEHVCLRLPF